MCSLSWSMFVNPSTPKCRMSTHTAAFPAGLRSALPLLWVERSAGEALEDGGPVFFLVCQWMPVSIEKNVVQESISYTVRLPHPENQRPSLVLYTVILISVISLFNLRRSFPTPNSTTTKHLSTSLFTSHAGPFLALNSICPSIGRARISGTLHVKVSDGTTLALSGGSSKR